MTDEINEETYDQLRQEWMDKIHHIKAAIKELGIDVRQHLDNLELALVLMTNISTLFARFKEKERTALFAGSHEADYHKPRR